MYNFIVDALKDKKFSAKHARDIVGLSYRQLNDWSSRGALPCEREGERGWRRFPPKEFFAMAVASELRSHYGIPVEKLQFVLDFMTKDDGRDHFVAAVQIMQRGLQVLLLTDLQKTFLMDSDLELEDMFQAGFLRAAGQGNYVLLNLNLIVNRLLGAGATPVKLKSSRTPYTDLAKIRQSYTACTKAEMKVLDLLRQPTSKKLTIHLDEGKMKRLEVERRHTT